MSDKKYSPREAAVLVLQKAQELYKNSNLMKSYEGFKAVEESARKSGASDPAAVAAAVGRKKYGKEAFQHAAAAGKKMGKSEENPDEKADAQLGEKVEDEVHQHEEKNSDPGQHENEMGMKGHIKLAKFMGRMEHKKSQMAKSQADPNAMQGSAGQAMPKPLNEK